MSRRVLAVLSLLVSVLALAAAGCGDDDEPPTGPPPIYSSIVITGPDTVLIDSTIVFTAVVLDTAGNVVPAPQLTWVSNSTAIATVNNAGRVTGQTEGETLIRASGGGIDSNLEGVAVIQGRGWVDQSDFVNTLQNLNGVCFVSARTGFIVGDLGTILHTTDAGGTWTLRPSLSTTYRLNAVSFATTTIGTIVGSGGRILRTTDGGFTWIILLGVDTDGLKNLNDVFFQDENRGWIVGDAGLILRTQNGGANWDRVLPAITDERLESVSFPRNPTLGAPPIDPYGFGWIVGTDGTILASDNFGQAWRLYLPSVDDPRFAGVARHSKTDGALVGADNAAAFTSPSADSALWSLSSPPNPFSVFEAIDWPGAPTAFFPAWAVGQNVAGGVPAVFRSTDGGQTWTPQLTPADAPLLGNTLNDVFFLDDRRGWAVGTQGLVIHTATGGQ